MKSNDRDLGMGRKIPRRDLFHGIAGLAAGALVPGQALADRVLAMEQAGVSNGVYPPALTGLRGSHAGSFEVSHQLAREGRRDWGALQASDSYLYDLVVVGAGISGLSAAYFYLKQHPGSRILILDNHDDFGGHAKRNEFQSGDKDLIGYGGSQSLESPSGYSEVVKTLLRDLGIDLNRFDSAYDDSLYKRYGLTSGTFFGREQWGVDRMVPYNLAMHAGYQTGYPSRLSAYQAVEQFPISANAREQMLALMTTEDDRLAHIPETEKWAYLGSISYREFLIRYGAVTEPEVFAVLQDLCADSCVGIEAATASTALGYNALPGWGLTGLAISNHEPYIHHFPDGNASVARLLVREMIPAVADGATMEDVVTQRFDYSMLDVPATPVRIRLNSSVIGVQHEGDPVSAKEVFVSYVKAGKKYRVKARSAVLACYNAMIPHLCPELPVAQKQALALQIKTPILYTNVALRNWQAWQKLGVGAAAAPGAYHVISMLDFPVSLGSYEFAKTPNDPIIVHMERFVHRNNEGLTPREQHRLGRHELLSTPYAEIELKTRQQLAAMLGERGFDPAVDIEAITVNRWSHGYASKGNPLFVPYYDDVNDERWPYVQGRKSFGRISIANSDAAGRAVLPAAVEQAYRAVNELKT